jgi:hypothetical protein
MIPLSHITKKTRFQACLFSYMFFNIQDFAKSLLYCLFLL